jgi:hypothetical protein
LVKGPNAGSQCKNEAQKDCGYCYRHKAKLAKPFREFQVLKLPMDIIIEIGTFFNYRDGLSFTRINKEIHTAFYLPGKNSRIWNLWFQGLYKSGNIEPRIVEAKIVDMKMQKYVIELYCQKECQRCRIGNGEFYPELLVRLCRNCFFEVSLSRSRLQIYYRVNKDVLNDVESVNMSLGYGAMGEFFIVKQVEELLGMSIDDYRKNSLEAAKESRSKVRKQRGELLAHQKSIRLEITKKVLNSLKSDTEIKGFFALTRLKLFDSIKSLDVEGINDADEFDDVQLNALVNSVRNEREQILDEKIQIDAYLETDIPSFETLPLRKQLERFDIVAQERTRMLSTWNNIKKLGKWKASEIEHIDEQFEAKNTKISEAIDILNERIKILDKIKHGIEKRKKRALDKFIEKLRNECREEELRIYPSLGTGSGRREMLIRELRKNGLRLRGDSTLCSSYISGSECPLGEVVAIMRMTSFLFSHSHIHFSEFHTVMKVELSREMYELKDTGNRHDWNYACSNTILKMTPNVSSFEPEPYDDYDRYW